MAHLTADGERAQLILISGFVIAVALVGLALVMNSAIYTENLATRSETSGAVDALSFRDATEENLESVLAAETDQHPDDLAAVRGDFGAAVEEYSDLSARQHASSERLVGVTFLGDTEGTRIYQNATGNFQSADSRENWTLASGVTDVRDFHIRVSTSTGLSDDRDFLVNATATGGDEWRVNVSQGTGITVRVNASGTLNTCIPPGGLSAPFWINVTEGTVDGWTCDALNFSSWASDRQFRLNFTNASKIDGRFEVTVDQPRSFPDGRFGSATTDPSADQLLYAARVGFVYRTAQLDYDTAVRVEPGEHDD